MILIIVVLTFIFIVSPAGDILDQESTHSYIPIKLFNVMLLHLIILYTISLSFMLYLIIFILTPAGDTVDQVQVTIRCDHII